MKCETGRNSLLEGLAFLLSGLTSPYVVIPLLSLAVVTWRCNDWREGLLWAGITIFFATIVPLLYVYAGMHRGTITDLHVMLREERLEPFVVATVSSLAGTLILHRLGAPMEIVMLGVVVVANGVVFALMSLFTKVSVHAAVVTVAIYVGGTFFHPAVYCLLLALPIVLWARLYRGRHSLWEGLEAILVAAGVTIIVFHVFSFALAPWRQ